MFSIILLNGPGILADMPLVVAYDTESFLFLLT
jgi:hypothetical protein